MKYGITHKIKHGIKYYIMSRLVAIVLIVLIAFAMVAYFAMQSIQEANISKRGSYDAQKNQIQIENAIDQIYHSSQLLSLNSEIRAFISTNQYNTPSQKIFAVNRLITQLDEGLLLDRYIHSFCIVDQDGIGYWNQCPYDDYFMTWFCSYALKGKPIEKQIGFTQSYTFPDHKQLRTENKLIGYVSNLYEVKNSSLNSLGQIIINLNLTTLMKDVASKKSLFSQIGILDEKGKLIYLSSGNESQFLQTAQELSSDFVKKDNGYYFVNTTSNTHWKIISFLSKDQITNTMDFPFLPVVILIIILSLCLLFIFIFPVLINISQQIVKLDHAIDLVANGNLDVSVNLSGPREMNNIAKGFNRMVVKTKQYMKDALKNLEEKQKVSFELLLAKINPHFIYNTLNSVIYLARQNRNEDVIELTGAFIYLLQDSIHLEENSLFALTETEIEVIQKYIIIQKYRYADQFSFECVFDPELKDTCIPKNILQPLIENAIIHGVCPSECPCRIELNVKKEGNKIRILIMDDGVGMEPSLANQLTDCTAPERIRKKSSKMRAIGLKNIAEKLQFVYHEDYEFTITSDPSFGTMIRLLLPIRTKDAAQKIKFI